MYETGIQIYTLLLRLAGIFNSKAGLLLRGRAETSSKIRLFRENYSGPAVWFHAASLGEFEQCRPVLESFKLRFPDRKIVLTFYSPSGFEVQKNYSEAALICYLPADSHAGAHRFVDALRPRSGFFCKI